MLPRKRRNSYLSTLSEPLHQLLFFHPGPQVGIATSPATAGLYNLHSQPGSAVRAAFTQGDTRVAHRQCLAYLAGVGD